MHPEMIKAEMRILGVTPAALADKMEISSTAVNMVIAGKQRSHRVMTEISRLLGKPIDSIWPPKNTGLRRRPRASSLAAVA